MVHLRTEFQQLLYDLVRHVVTGELAVEDALSFFTELTSSLVRCQANMFIVLRKKV